MSTWWRVRWRPDRRAPAPPDAAAETVWFLDGTPEEYGWARGYPSPGADLAAARAWARTARAAAAHAGGEPVTVVGEGALAELVRRVTTAEPDGASRVAVDTTGTTTGISAALRMLRPGGVVYLAARPLWPSPAIRTYHDVHRRGLTLRPVPWAGGQDRPDGAAGTTPDALMEWALAHLETAEPGQPAPPARWYRMIVGSAANAPGEPRGR